MPWNPNNASSQFTQRAQQQAQHFHRHNQQYAAQQMNALIAQDRALRFRRQQKRIRQQQDGASVQPDGVFTQPERGVSKVRERSKAVLILDILIVAMMLAIIAVASTAGYRVVSGSGAFGLHPAVAGSVLVGSNVREGPGKSFTIVAVLESGSKVSVSCVDAGWARLASPYAGRYIARGLLSLKKEPKACQAGNAP